MGVRLWFFRPELLVNSFQTRVSATRRQQLRGGWRKTAHWMDCAMAQAVSRRPLVAEVRIQSKSSPCGICGGRSRTSIWFSANTSDFPC